MAQSRLEGVPPSGAPEPLGNKAQVSIFCDSTHGATSFATRQLTTGILVILNEAPGRWCKNRQSTIMSSTFGYKFVAMKSALKTNAALQYKLQMMCVPIEVPLATFGDNNSVIKMSCSPSQCCTSATIQLHTINVARNV
jgi:hypothetical protein